MLRIPVRCRRFRLSVAPRNDKERRFVNSWVLVSVECIRLTVLGRAVNVSSLVAKSKVCRRSGEVTNVSLNVTLPFYTPMYMHPLFCIRLCDGYHGLDPIVDDIDSVCRKMSGVVTNCIACRFGPSSGDMLSDRFHYQGSTIAGPDSFTLTTNSNRLPAFLSGC